MATQNAVPTTYPQYDPPTHLPRRLRHVRELDREISKRMDVSFTSVEYAALRDALTAYLQQPFHLRSEYEAKYQGYI